MWPLYDITSDNRLGDLDIKVEQKCLTSNYHDPSAKQLHDSEIKIVVWSKPY